MDDKTKIDELVSRLKSEVGEHFRPLNERLEAEAKERGEATAETKQALGKVNDRLDELEASIAAAANGRNDDASAKADAGVRNSALVKWLRVGDEAEAKAAGMRVADDTEGGFLAPIEVARELIAGLVEFSPVRQLARVRPTSARAVQFPKVTQRVSAAWADEIESRDETDGPRFGMDEVPTHEQYASVRVSRIDLEDTELDLEAYIRGDVAEQFAVAEGKSFVDGSGVKRPLGFLVASSGVGTVNLGHASTVTADGLLDLVYDLPEAYATGAGFLMKRSTVRAIRGLKDSNGDYLWIPGLTGTAPASILGHPYREAPDMPAVASGARSIAFGDFRRGYTIVDRVAVSYDREPVYKTGEVIVHARRRVGGQVRDPKALRIGVIAA